LILMQKYISQICDDLKKYVEMGHDTCISDECDYTDKYNRQKYLLLHSYNDVFEYKRMFSRLLSRERFSDRIEVVSVGCRNMLDYYALVSVLEKCGMRKCNIKYKGIDAISWDYRMKNRDMDEVIFLKKNAAEVFEKSNRLTSDVYIFPNSTTIFSDKEFSVICKAFEIKKILKKRIHILISLKNENDVERSRQLMSALNKNGYISKDKPTSFISLKTEDADKPDEVKKMIDALYTEESDKDVGVIRYQVLTFDKMN